MSKLNEWFTRHPGQAALVRHTATAATTLLLSFLVTLEVIGPAILDSCQTVVVQRLADR